MGFLKPKPATSSSSSSNQAYGALNTAYSPSIATGNNATNFIGGLLGVPGGDAAGAEAGFSRFKDLAGFAPALAALQKGVVGGQAARGLLNSGSTQTRLLTKGAELNQSTFGNFMQQLAGLSGLGLQGGGIVANAGQQSQSQGEGASPSTAGTIASAVGGIAKAIPGIGGVIKGIGKIFSDRRTKRDIVHLTNFEDGLGIYRFKYHGDDEVRIGVMADEVEKIRPWALGPVVGGFQTVDYGAL